MQEGEYMTEEQNNHLQRIQKQFTEEHRAKFEAGVLEHKTQLHKDYSAIELLDFTIEEIIDLVSYAYTLREKLKASLAYCEQQNGLPYCKNCGLGE